jgi:hydrogenase nickel incorporation protein HypB
MATTLVHRAPRSLFAACENRRTLDSSGTVCLNLIGSAGAGKTALLEAMLPRLKTELRCGVITGDLAAAQDTERIRAAGAPLVRVLTDPHGHLNPDLVRTGLGQFRSGLDLLMIESLGSIVAQAKTDLGEHLRIGVLSVAGGDTVGREYPQLFRNAALILLTKYDLLPHVDFDLDRTVRALKKANPQAEIICTGVRRRVGIDRVAGWLMGYVRAQRSHRGVIAGAREPMGAATH